MSAILLVTFLLRRPPKSRLEDPVLPHTATAPHRQAASAPASSRDQNYPHQRDRACKSTHVQGGTGAMAYWLLKSEPEDWSWAEQIAKGREGAEWTGIRNFAAQ